MVVSVVKSVGQLQGVVVINTQDQRYGAHEPHS